jgi:branched-chain amino acid transport system substrate-binding protein
MMRKLFPLFCLLSALGLFSSCAVENRRPELAVKSDRKKGEKFSSRGRPSGMSPGTIKAAPGNGGPPPQDQSLGQPPIEPLTDPLSQPDALVRQGQTLEALRLYVIISAMEPHTNVQDSARLKAVDLIETKIDQKHLETISEDPAFGFARGHALFRLGKSSMESRDLRGARKYFSNVAMLLPGSDLGIRASDFLAQIDVLDRVEAKTIGVVLPLSGKNSPLGMKALRGIELGFGLHQSSSNFKLALIDSEGNPDAARRGVERLIKEDNVIAIVGSLLSKTATAVAAKANEFGVPSIGLSQKSGLTEVGPAVFRNSLTAEMQVRHLVKVALAQGLKKFAILYPNDSYGTEYANAFWDEVVARGGEITSVQSYDPKETDFRYSVQRLVGTFYIEARLDEYKIKSKDMAESNKKSRATRENINADDILPPLVDFDAVFIPDGAKTMGQLSAFLSYSGVKNVALLGTSLWNSAGLGKRAGHFSNRLLFVDGLWLGSSTKKKSRFYQEYLALFQEEPGFIEFQAYDSALLLRQLIVQGANSRQELTERLTHLSRFPGSLGDLSMSQSRELTRPVIALTVDKFGEVTPFDITHKNF